LENVLECQKIYKDAILEGLREVHKVSSEGDSKMYQEIINDINKRSKASWTNLDFFLKDEFSLVVEHVSNIRESISKNGNQL
jgi:hypothetical protein